MVLSCHNRSEVLLQRLWELKVNLDDPVPDIIKGSYHCAFNGFCDAWSSMVPTYPLNFSKKSFRDTYAWTDSTIVLNWLSGSPRRFKTFIGNCVSSTIEHISLDRWNHVSGLKTQPTVHLAVSFRLSC